MQCCPCIPWIIRGSGIRRRSRRRYGQRQHSWKIVGQNICGRGSPRCRWWFRLRRLRLWLQRLRSHLKGPNARDSLPRHCRHPISQDPASPARIGPSVLQHLKNNRKKVVDGRSWRLANILPHNYFNQLYCSTLKLKGTSYTSWRGFMLSLHD